MSWYIFMMSRRNYTITGRLLLVKRSSAGLGLFAGESIGKNECVIEYVGRVISKEEEFASKSLYLFHVKRGMTLDGKPKINKAGYINHSCKPNCEIEVYKSRVYVFSKKKIEAGEELTYDYGKEYFDEHIAPNCRCVKCAPGLQGTKRSLQKQKH
jgi:SET domain-containing protein